MLGNEYGKIDHIIFGIDGGQNKIRNTKLSNDLTFRLKE